MLRCPNCKTVIPEAAPGMVGKLLKVLGSTVDGATTDRLVEIIYNVNSDHNYIKLYRNRVTKLVNRARSLGYDIDHEPRKNKPGIYRIKK